MTVGLLLFVALQIWKLKDHLIVSPHFSSTRICIQLKTCNLTRQVPFLGDCHIQLLHSMESSKLAESPTKLFFGTLSICFHRKCRIPHFDPESFESPFHNKILFCRFLRPLHSLPFFSESIRINFFKLKYNFYINFTRLNYPNEKKKHLS